MNAIRNHSRLWLYLTLVFIVTTACLLLNPVKAFAAEKLYTNPETGYYVIIEDDADLLSDAEESDLVETMKLITNYGNAVFKSISSNTYSSTEEFANNYYYSLMGNDSGSVFLFDMAKRNIYFVFNGSIYKKLGKEYADTITDNTYRYASAKKYFTCADESFSQAFQILEGHRIAQPMKYVSNALLAILVALLINFSAVNKASKLKSIKMAEMLKTAIKEVHVRETAVRLVKQTRRYSPQSSGSSSGFHGGGGGFHGGGGGGFHGGGGGHGF